MKYCERPFKHVYVMPNGNVLLCSWNTKPIGNLLENSLEEIWNGSIATEIRKSIKDNSFRYCKTTGCPFCENGSLKTVDEDNDELFTPLVQPVEFNCAIDYTCNHSCPSCRHEVFIPDEKYIKNMDIIIEKLLPYLPNAEFVSTDGQGDCFASPKVMKMLENITIKNPNMRITLETNGVLFDEAHWKRIEHLSKAHMRVVVTPNSFEKATYKYLSGGHDNVDKLLENLKFIRSLREKELINDFAISIVVQDRNFRELPAFCEKCIDEFHVDSVSIKPIYKWFKLKEDEYLEKDILNPLHPYFDEYQDVWKDERLKNPKIFWWGAKNIHPAKKMPKEKYIELWDVAADWLNLVLDNPECVQEYLRKKGYQKVAIYGYGRVGKMLYKNIKEMTNLIIDRLPKCVNDKVVTVLACEEKYPDTDLVIVTPMSEYNSIIDSISGKTTADIVSLQELIKKIKKENC